MSNQRSPSESAKPAGAVCVKHNEYSATGVCRWCEPARASGDARAAGAHFLGVPIVLDPTLPPGGWAIGTHNPSGIEWAPLYPHQSPSVAPPSKPAPTCTMWNWDATARCGAPAVARLLKPMSEPVEHCAGHYNLTSEMFGEWEPIAPARPGNARNPKSDL